MAEETGDSEARINRSTAPVYPHPDTSSRPTVTPSRKPI